MDWSSGLVFELNLAAFAEPDPVFAYWDDNGSQAASISGLEGAGYADIDRYGVLHDPDPATISAFSEGR